ncbi:MAG: hypothetical protein EAX91_17035 [Candidatus Lokiarchaeota archaeon]|nr:hypothetical protein [Candidatus Lokiarchaeota archaeon]
MDPLNLLKIVTTITTAIIALIIGLRILSLNRRDLLNVWFTLYFMTSSLGFIFYAVYHLIFNNANIIIPLMITAQILFNLNSISLIMTVFALEKYSQIAMSVKYFGTMTVVFFVMTIGYFLFPPYLDMGDYALDIVNTHTPPGLFIFVNAIRLLLAVYAVLRYIIITKKLEGKTKKKVKWFILGVLVLIMGLFTNLLGGLLSLIVVEVVALIIVDIGAILVLKGFLIK